MASQQEQSAESAGGNGGNSTNDEPAQQQQEEGMAIEELLYSTASFHAIVKPVALTMILTALCVIFINTPETFAATQEALSVAYVAFDTPEDASTAEKVGLSLTNALIIVSVICAMTFVIVLLYKYRCLKCLIGYMVFASAALMGFLGGNLFQVAIDKYSLAVDQFSYYFCLWNFSAVGTGAIFAPWGGFPMWITQGSLIATSVILAWQLAALDSWTSWALLIMLALYDLCAVLTPCGPLKALVNLMSEDDSPDMPGLLYEAELPFQAQRPGRRRSSMAQSRRSTAATVTAQSSTADEETNVDASVTQSATVATAAVVSDEDNENNDNESLPGSMSDVQPLVPVTMTVPPSMSQEKSESLGIEMTRTATTDEEATPVTARAPQPLTVAARMTQTAASMAASQSQQSVQTQREPRPRASLPFAIAKLYKLPIESEEPERRSSWTPLLEGEHLNPNETLARQYTPQQLKAHVTVIFPRNGGRIETVGSKYIVKDRHGNIKRILLLDEQGRVLEERQRTPEEEREDDRKSNNIKLGLGDFIFYSVLVSKSVLYSFTTFVACFLVILAGLGMTLVLLAVYRKALPALPISIMLGVIFYLATRGLIEPWYEAVLITPYYV